MLNILSPFSDDFIIIADNSNDEIYYTKMSSDPDFQSSLVNVQSGVLNDPNRVDYDCVDQKIYITDDGTSSVPGFVGRFNIDGSDFEKVVEGYIDCMYLT